MAKAEKKYKEDFDVVLTLTYQEAQTLADMCGKVGGGDRTRRRDSEMMLRSLHEIGIDSKMSARGEITFVDIVY